MLECLQEQGAGRKAPAGSESQGSWRKGPREVCVLPGRCPTARGAPPTCHAVPSGTPHVCTAVTTLTTRAQVRLWAACCWVTEAPPSLLLG